jgi:hypothetical protein
MIIQGAAHWRHSPTSWPHRAGTAIRPACTASTEPKGHNRSALPSRSLCGIAWHIPPSSGYWSLCSTEQRSRMLEYFPRRPSTVSYPVTRECRTLGPQVFLPLVVSATDRRPLPCEFGYVVVLRVTTAAVAINLLQSHIAPERSPEQHLTQGEKPCSQSPATENRGIRGTAEDRTMSAVVGGSGSDPRRCFARDVTRDWRHRAPRWPDDKRRRAFSPSRPDLAYFRFFTRNGGSRSKISSVSRRLTFCAT